MLVNFDVASRTDERRAGIQSKSVKATVDRAEAGHALRTGKAAYQSGRCSLWVYAIEAVRRLKVALAIEQQAVHVQRVAKTG